MFARPAYGEMGNAARILDWARNPWKPGLDMSLRKQLFPFDNRRRYIQFRGDFFNVPVSGTGVRLGGPIPYVVGQNANSYPQGTREQILARYYTQSLVKLDRNNNLGGRVIQLACRIYFRPRIGGAP